MNPRRPALWIDLSIRFTVQCDRKAGAPRIVRHGRSAAIRLPGAVAALRRLPARASASRTLRPSILGCKALYVKHFRFSCYRRSHNGPTLFLAYAAPSRERLGCLRQSPHDSMNSALLVASSTGR